MNELIGLLPWMDQTIHPQELQIMARGFGVGEGRGAWIEDGIALGQMPRGPAPARDSPTVLGKDGLVLAAGARLDNRADLLREFAIPWPEQDGTTDEMLVLAACLRWREDAPRHLLGDWQLALWDRSRRSLLLARDPWGHAALYYHQDASRLAFATDIRALLALPEVPHRPNLQVAADRLMGWHGDGIATFHEGIRRLPAGHMVRISAGRMELRRYWDPSTLAPLRLARDEDYVEALLELYQEAVRVRLGEAGTVAATLSGGLDSGSVVALAAPMLAAQGRELLALTAVPDLATEARPGKFGDEWPLASATARMAGTGGCLQHLPVACHGASILASIQRHYEIHLDPGRNVGNFHWLHEILDQCRLRDIRTLLVGQSGNGSVSWSGTGSLILPLLRGDLGATIRALRAEPNPWLALKRQVILPLITPVRNARREWASSHQPWRRYSAITPGFIRDSGILERMRAEGWDPAFTRPATKDMRLQMFRHQTGSLGTFWKEMGDSCGLEVNDPTRDLRLVEFCLRVPDDQYRRRGQSRWLLRRAMRGRIPDCVLDNSSRGLQSADIGHRVLRERAGVLETLDRLEASADLRSMLDLPLMLGILRSLEEGVTPANTALCHTILLRGLAVGLALLRF